MTTERQAFFDKEEALTKEHAAKMGALSTKLEQTSEGFYSMQQFQTDCDNETTRYYLALAALGPVPK